MSERFYLDTPPQNGQVHFPETEAQHLAKVMRASTGDTVIAFDGQGTQFEIELIEVSKKRVIGQVKTALEISREPVNQLSLAVALPKGDRQRWLVEKCTELGVARIIPLMTQRSVAQPVGNAIERMRRMVIEASKQCGRNHLMHIEEGQTLSSLLANTDAQTACWILHPTCQPIPSQPTETPHNLLAAIGPEGGFTDEEIEQAQTSGFQAVRLGPRILRVETAAATIAAKMVTDQDG